MYDCRRHYIGGAWHPAARGRELPIVNPATEATIGHVALGTAGDVDAAVAAARAAFPSYSATTRQERLAMFQRIEIAYQARFEEVARALSAEVGCPISLARGLQAQTALLHLNLYSGILKDYAFHDVRGTSAIRREPIGVCGLIAPWNWPINQICVKLIPALAAGCTVVLKPSEVTPAGATLLMEVLHEAGVPAGVVNLVHGAGPEVGMALAAHPDVDMVSFTGSTRAGRQVAVAAAASVKRVAQELGGKSPWIVLPDADLPTAVNQCIDWVLLNSGQSCSAPTRLLVPASQMDAAVGVARKRIDAAVIGDPASESTTMGPVVSEAQWNRIQSLIQSGIDEGATLAVGGTGRPDGFERGFFVRPTVFSHVDNSMTIAQEEIFGPVLVIIGYRDLDDAVRIANETPYGLSAYVSSNDISLARAVADRIRAGSVYLNGAGIDPMAPFGGYKQSGNGREWGINGLEEYLETKAVLGYVPAATASANAATGALVAP